jgi:hypothetical protein
MFAGFAASNLGGGVPAGPPPAGLGLPGQVAASVDVDDPYGEWGDVYGGCDPETPASKGFGQLLGFLGQIGADVRQIGGGQ